MLGIQKRFFVLLAILSLLGLGCAAATRLFAGDQPLSPTKSVVSTAPKVPFNSTAILTTVPTASTHSSADPWLSEITFCKDVTDDGECLEKTTTFPKDTHTVWSYFHYSDMQDGTSWSRVWERNGEIYIESGGLKWEDGREGWLAFSISDENDLGGDYSLTITVNNSLVRVGVFSVDAAMVQNTQKGIPSFGPITFAHGVEDNVPIDPTERFEPGVKEINAVFAYTQISVGTAWATEWLKDGEVLVKTDREWNKENTDGVHSASFSYSGGEDLNAGKYTLNLYINGQIARSASVEVATAPKTDLGPATAEELVDPNLLRPFNLLVNHPLPVLQSVGQTALDYRIPVSVGDQCGAGAVACFKYTCDDKQSGEVYVTPKEMNQADALVAASLAHELTHAIQFHAGWKCGCTVEKEYYAVAAEIDMLWYGGYENIVNKQYGALWKDDGKIDTTMLWNVIKKAYSDCPDY